MTDIALPGTIEAVFNKYSEPDALFSALLPILGQVLKCDGLHPAGGDRCFLYITQSQN